MNAGLGSPFVRALALDPSAPQTLYVGTFGGGVFKGINGASTWTPMNSGLENTYVFALVLNPSAPQTLYAGTYGSGVFAIRVP